MKVANRKRLEEALARGRLTLMLDSQIAEIRDDRIRIRIDDSERELRNDAVIVCAGGELPTPFLKKIGVLVETHHGA